MVPQEGAQSPWKYIEESCVCDDKWWVTMTEPWKTKRAKSYAKSLQSCPTLCNSIDSSPSGSPVPGILQARTLEWVAISFSNVWKWKVKVKSLSHVRLFTTPRTAAHQAPPSMGFSKQEYWSGVPLPSPGQRARLMLNKISGIGGPPSKDLQCWSWNLETETLRDTAWGSIKGIKVSKQE